MKDLLLLFKPYETLTKQSSPKGIHHKFSNSSVIVVFEVKLISALVLSYVSLINSI